MKDSQTHRNEGAAKELGGKVKKTVGKVIGDEEMEARGTLKEAEGVAQKEAGKAAEHTKGVVQELHGAVKNRVGQVIDNEQMAVEGKAKELEGKARQKVNKPG
jgi:uncharacterized protein YjbJ (UPF0337 family)